MRFVYATRHLPHVEFAAASRRETIPAGAEVYAVCDGALTLRQKDEQILGALTDEEQAHLQAMIADSQSAELASCNSGSGWLRRIWQRLFIAEEPK